MLGTQRLEYAQRAMRDGQIENIELVGRCIGQVKEKLEQELGLTLTEASIAAAGRALKTKKVTVERKLNAAEVITCLLYTSSGRCRTMAAKAPALTSCMNACPRRRR